jgi:hypothetical protein
MSTTPEDAAHALREVDQVVSRSATLNGYRRASPILIVWGLIWITANVACDLRPLSAGLIWIVADIIGLAITATLVRRTSDQRNWRYLAAFGVVTFFLIAAEILLKVKSAEQATAFITLAIAAAYMLNGVWRGVRFFILGLVVAAVCLVDAVVQPPHFFIWLAVAGGGSLVLGGLWLRQA